VLGVRVEEFLPLREGETTTLENADGTTLTARAWAEDLLVDGAETVARYVDGPAAGRAALTRHAYGAGTGWYVSTSLDADSLAHVMAAAYADAGVSASAVPAGCEVVVRRSDAHDFTFVVNHRDDAVDLSLDGTELLTGASIDGSLTVPAGGIAVVRTAREEAGRA